MAAFAPQVTTPPMTERPPVPLAPRPPVGGPGVPDDAFKVAKEKVSQEAGNIPTEQALLAAIAAYPGGNQLSSAQQAELVDIWGKTRTTHSEPAAAPVPPPTQLSTLPPGSPAATVPTQLSTLPPPGATPPPATAPPPAANSNVDQVPQMGPLPAPPQQGTPTQAVPQYTPPTYNKPEYKAPAKGLEYAAMALALLFPGAPIARAAASFAQGLGAGAEQKYERAKAEADTQYKVDLAAKQADFQNRLATYNAEKDTLAVKFANDQVAYKAGIEDLKRRYGNDVAIYSANQELRARGIDPKTQQPFILPPALAKPPPAQAGDAGLQKWHTERAQFYTSVGATQAAAREAEAAKEANQRAIDAANNNRALLEARARVQQQWMIHVDTQQQENARQSRSLGQSWAIHQDSEARADRRAAYGTPAERSRYGLQAFDANRILQTTFQKLTTAPMKVVKQPDGSERQVPVLDGQGHPLAAPLSGANLQTVTSLIREIGRSRDPAGAAEYYAAHQDQTPSGIAASELLFQAGKAAELKRLASGIPIEPGSFPEIKPPPKPPAPKKRPRAELEAEARAAGLDLNDPDVKKRIDDLALPEAPDKLTLPPGMRGPGNVPGLIPRNTNFHPGPMTRNPYTGQLLPPGSYLPPR